MPSLTTVVLASLFIAPSMLRVAAACNPGYYKPLFSSTCTACPAGTYDNSNGNGLSQLACTSCPEGTSNPNPGQAGSASCSTCGPGYFTSDTGSKTCCQCCAGYYSSTDHASCTKCPSGSTYSPPGSSGTGACVSGTSAQRNTVPTTCAIDTGSFGQPDYCPAVVKSGPEGSQVKKRRNVYKCTRGYESCALHSGRGGFECVDTRNDPEMCGGCVGPDGEGEGQDCTAIFGVSVTTCVKSRCVIQSCRKGFRKSADGKSCLREGNGLHVQQPGQSRVTRGRF